MIIVYWLSLHSLVFTEYGVKIDASKKLFTFPLYTYNLARLLVVFLFFLISVVFVRIRPIRTAGLPGSLAGFL